MKVLTEVRTGKHGIYITAAVCSGQTHITLTRDHDANIRVDGPRFSLIPCNGTCTAWEDTDDPLTEVVWFLHRRGFAICSEVAAFICAVGATGRNI